MNRFDCPVIDSLRVSRNIPEVELKWLQGFCLSSLLLGLPFQQWLCWQWLSVQPIKCVELISKVCLRAGKGTVGVGTGIDLI